MKVKQLRVVFRNGNILMLSVDRIHIDEDFVDVWEVSNIHTQPSHTWLRNQIRSFSVGRTTYEVH